MSGTSAGANKANETKREASDNKNQSSHQASHQGRGSNLTDEARRKGGEHSHSGSNNKDDKR